MFIVNSLVSAIFNRVFDKNKPITALFNPLQGSPYRQYSKNASEKEESSLITSLRFPDGKVKEQNFTKMDKKCTVLFS